MPDVLSNEAYAYLSANDEYFWRWVDDGEIIEWSNGTTLAHRRELLELMAVLVNHGLPPFGALLLFLAACRRGWLDPNAELGILQDIARQTRKERAFDRVRPMLDVIASLPESLRTGLRAQQLLAGMLFEPISWKLSVERSKEILDVLRHEELAAAVTAPPAPRAVDHAFSLDLRALESALRGLNPRLLERRLRTGLEGELEPPTLPLPEPEPRDLLSDLAADPETEGLARLTRRLLAVLRIPRQAESPGDLPCGGFADITNRGTPDRLLLSELALDDLSLTARIANGEALYLRREAPPAKPKKKRILLLDNGIRLWGVPRIFSLSVAIALLHSARDSESCDVFSHYEGRFQPVDLRSRGGIDKQLERLEPATHPGLAMRRLELGNGEETEHILITHEAVLGDRAFRIALASLSHQPAYVVTVNREGRVRLLANSPAGQKVLVDARLDVAKLVRPSSGQEPPLQRQDIPGDLPYIFGCEPFPFRLPAHLYQGGKPAIIHPDHGVVAVTSDRRLLHWDKPGLGGRQLAYTVPKARSYFTAINAAGRVAVLALTDSSLQLVQASVGGGMPTLLDLGPPDAEPLHMELATDWFLIFYQDAVEVCECQSGRSLERAEYPADAYLWWGNIIATEGRLLKLHYDGMKLVHTQLSADDATQLARRKDPKRLTAYTRSTYSMMHRFRVIGFNRGGALTLESHNGRLWDICIASGELRLVRSEAREVSDLHNRQSFEPIPGPEKADFRLLKATWPNGSEAVLDSRGLLHLRCHDPQLPELAFGLCHLKPMPAWSSTGDTTGPAYFFPESSLTPVQFHDQLQRLLEKMT